MRLKSRLSLWEKNGLISADNASAIQSFEKNRTSKQFAIGFQMVGVFSILLGFAMVIGANWQEIGPYAKLAAHFALNAGLGIWLLKLHKTIGQPNDRPILREGVCLALFGLTLTFIALIGQVFQLDGSTAAALILWMILSVPMMMMFPRSRFSASLWFVALIVTVIMGFFEFSKPLGDFEKGVFGYFLALFVPLSVFGDHCMTITRKYRPEFSDVFRRGSLVLLICAATLSGFWFYGAGNDFYRSASHGSQHYLFIGLITACAFVYIGFLKTCFKDHEEPSDWTVLNLCVAAMALPLFIVVDLDFLGALLFMGFWMGLGYIWQKAGEDKLVSLAITLVTLRLYIVFLEVFGGLMTNGIGLILAGCVLIGMVKGAKRFSNFLKETV